jgi:hypothetical protein
MVNSLVRKYKKTHSKRNKKHVKRHYSKKKSTRRTYKRKTYRHKKGGSDLMNTDLFFTPYTKNNGSILEKTLDTGKNVASSVVEFGKSSVNTVTSGLSNLTRRISQGLGLSS